ANNQRFLHLLGTITAISLIKQDLRFLPRGLERGPEMNISPKNCVGPQPPAIRAVRWRAGAAPDPIHIGRGCCNGLGLIETASKLKCLPWYDTLSSVHRRRTISNVSTTRDKI